MKELNQVTYEELARLEAEKEARCTAESVAQEIEPLIREYFYGDIEREGNTVNLKLLNGQTFRITCSEN